MRAALPWVALFLAACGIRAAYMASMRDQLPFATLVTDGRAYDLWAQRIVAGDWIGSEVFYQAPLYPYFLAVVYRCGGHDPMLVRAVQAVLGAASCVLLAWAGVTLFSRRVGLVAGAMLAVYPPAIFFDGLIQKASLDGLLVTLFLALLAEFQARRHWGWIVATGIALGAFSLNRENARVLYPVVAAWLLLAFRDASWRQRALWAGALTAGMAAMLLPVAVRNHVVGGEFLISTSQLGPNFYIGNHAGADGRYQPLRPGRGDPLHERADATQLAEEQLGRTLSPGEVSDYWLAKSLDFIRTQPIAWLRLTAWKTFLVFNSAELVDAEGFDAYARFSWILRLPSWFLNFGVVTVLAVLGIWATRADARRLAILYAMIAVLAASVALFFVFARYRYSLVPLLLLFAAAALVAIPEMVRDVRAGLAWRRWGAGWLLAALAAIPACWPMPGLREIEVTYFTLGTGLLDDARPDEAAEAFREAIAIKPEFAVAYHNLGNALLAQVQYAPAADAYAAALRIDPTIVPAHTMRSRALTKLDRQDEAIEHLRRAAELEPGDVLVRAELTQSFLARGNAAAAVAELRAALQRVPESTLLANNLAWILATHPDSAVRRGDEAVALAERVVKAVGGNEPSSLDTLAAALAEAGRFDEAAATAARAAGLAREAKQPALAEQIETHQREYVSRRPWREVP